MPILALDVQDTILFYNYAEEDKEGNFPPMIDPRLPGILKELKNLGWVVLLASATEDARINEQERQFKQVMLAGWIDYFRPINAEYNDSKYILLNKYLDMLQQRKEDVFFFDDAKKNITEAIEHGYKNSFLVDPHVSSYGNLCDLIESKLDLTSVKAPTPSSITTHSIFKSSEEIEGSESPKKGGCNLM